MEKNVAEIEKAAPKLLELYGLTGNGTQMNKHYTELVSLKQATSGSLQRFIAHVFDVEPSVVGSNEVMFGTLYLDDAATDSAIKRVESAIGGLDTVWDDAINTMKKDVKKIRNFLNTSTQNYYSIVDTLSKNRGKSLAMRRIGKYLKT